MSKRRDPDWWSTKTRDFVLFVGGFFGVLYETVVEQVDRPALLAVFGGMLGLPVFLARDPRKDVSDDDDEPAPNEKKHRK